ncbi:MAG: UDP-N-acetylglucosamine 1-carboxyvinyltransferase [Fidelibacterota bacterium]
MDKFVINGGRPLRGEIAVSGAKNAVLPIMVSALLVDGETTIHRVPDLRDTRTMVKLLEMTGAGVSFNNHTLIIDGSTVDTPVAPYELVKTMRASFYAMGPLLGRFGRAHVSLPGGCAWGPRPVDYHLKGFERLGAEIELKQGYIEAKAKKLSGNEIHFETPSVGATGNILMAAVLAEGRTLISNAAREPEITQLCDVLNSMGARIEGIGSNTLTINGVKKLNSVEVTIIPDRIEAGTFLIAGAALGNITVKAAEPDHLKVVMEKIQLAGAEISVEGKDITIKRPDRLHSCDLTTDVYPGFPTDLQAQWIALMTIAEGSSVVTDSIYHDRFAHVPELVRLGANIHLENNVAVVRGVENLRGAPVMSTDIRASASLLIAALIAEGRSEISRVYHIDRGYEEIEKKFRSLGADIRRVSD